ncbi:MAG: flagellar hook-associated protein FlgK [Gemmataceae bacterium]|nr:flagellar hook-associated protein FlgK [Gemmataceae bacterium]
MKATAIGLSALSVGQRALDIIGQNVANAATPGYHRRRPHLVPLVHDGFHGTGVAIQRIVRYEDRMLRSAILNVTSEAAVAHARIDVENQVQSLASATQIDQQMARFFDAATQLSARPSDLALRRTLLTAATEVAASFQRSAIGLGEIHASVRRSAEDVVRDINRLTANIAQLNKEIVYVLSKRGEPHDLRDQQDGLIAELAQLVNITVLPQTDGSKLILAASSPVVVSGESLPLKSEIDGAGRIILSPADTTFELPVTHGRLAGLFQEFNEFVPRYLDRLNTLAREWMRAIDQTQATGLGLDGPYTQLSGTRSVFDATLPLDSAGLALPVQTGELFITVTDETTGTRELVSLSIDPSVHSLNDLATMIGAATSGRVTASVTVNRTLDLQASAGYRFDFAGRLPTSPESVAMAGTSIPRVTGVFEGPANDQFFFQVVGSGTIGVTPGLTLEVRDQLGNLLATHNVGDGYTPGAELPATQGIRVALSAGTTNNGTFSTRMIAQADTVGILPALGINSFFVGSDAASIAVNPRLLDDPRRVNASRDGFAGDSRNVERLVALRDQRLLESGTRTLGQYSLDTQAMVGSEVRSLDARREATAALKLGLEQQEQGLIGVDVNEEMVRLLEFQRLIESASKYLMVVNRAMDAIMEIFR